MKALFLVMALISKNQNERRSAMNLEIRVFGERLWAERAL